MFKMLTTSSAVSTLWRYVESLIDYTRQLMSRRSSSWKHEKPKYGYELRVGDQFVSYQIGCANGQRKEAYVIMRVCTVKKISKSAAVFVFKFYGDNGLDAEEEMTVPFFDRPRSIRQTSITGRFVDNADRLVEDHLVACFTGERSGSWREIQEQWGDLAEELRALSNEAIGRRTR